MILSLTNYLYTATNPSYHLLEENSSRSGMKTISRTLQIRYKYHYLTIKGIYQHMKSFSGLIFLIVMKK